MKSLIFLFMLIASANFDKETKIFEKYLQQVHKTSISNSITNYYVIRESNCGGCYSETLQLVRSKLRKKNTLVIYSYSGVLKESAKFLKGNKKVLFDSLAIFNKKNISPYSDCIITASNGKIIKLVKLQ